MQQSTPSSDYNPNTAVMETPTPEVKETPAAPVEPTPASTEAPAEAARAGSRNALVRVVQKWIEGPAFDRWIGPIDKAIGFMLPRKDYQYDNEVVQAASGPIRFGLWSFFIVFIVFGIWGGTAPLDSAAVAPGVIVLDSHKKSIQHLEGGIVDEILVKDGDFVQAGQPLIKLSETSAKARVDLLKGQLRSSKALEARLIAERDRADYITFPEMLESLRTTDEDVAKIIDTQERLFASRRENLAGQKSVIMQRINQLREEIEGLRSQTESVTEQMKLTKEEQDVVQQLVDKGQAVRPRLLALQRKTAELEGQRGEYLAMKARAEQTIAQNEQEMLNLESNAQNEVVTQLRNVQSEISDADERVRAADDIFDRLIISSPHTGIVQGLKVYTKGGVIQPGAEIMSIVPQDDELIVEAKINPQDIDVVHKGLKAKIHLSAYKSRKVPNVDGEVTSVSADRFVDQVTNQPYYLARVQVNPETIKKLANKVDLYPGMAADVLIVTGSKTMLGYFFDPLTLTLHRAFREE